MRQQKQIVHAELIEENAQAKSDKTGQEVLEGVVVEQVLASRVGNCCMRTADKHLPQP